MTLQRGHERAIVHAFAEKGRDNPGTHFCREMQQLCLCRERQQSMVYTWAESANDSPYMVHALAENARDDFAEKARDNHGSCLG